MRSSFSAVAFLVALLGPVRCDQAGRVASPNNSPSSVPNAARTEPARLITLPADQAAAAADVQSSPEQATNGSNTAGPAHPENQPGIAGEPSSANPAGAQEKAAKKPADADSAEIKLLASPDSAADVRDWIRKARPDVWKDTLTQTTIINATAEIMVEDRTGGTACVRATFIIPPLIFTDDSRTTGTARKARDKPGSEFHLILFWVLGDQGTWLLKVDRFAKASPRSNKD